MSYIQERDDAAVVEFVQHPQAKNALKSAALTTFERAETIRPLTPLGVSPAGSNAVEVDLTIPQRASPDSAGGRHS
jgi:hypothetical protein